MRAVQITRFGGPEVLDIVDIPEPEAGLSPTDPELHAAHWTR
jgi:NADPH:quinone reductase-like Zn-dependent oxidoreductase